MPAPHHHKERLSELLAKEIGLIISNDMRDPRIPPIVSIMDMKVAPDARDATVMVSVYGSEKEKAGAIIALNHSTPYIQKLLGQRIRTRHIPKLLFRLDESLEKSQQINDLLKEVQDDIATP